jgi:hypothetical protein
MKVLICALLAIALTATAADTNVTGKWSGSFVMSGPDGSKEGTAFLNLKQEGVAITGSVGPEEGEQYPIKTGKIDGDKISLDVDHNGRTMKFTLVLADDHIKGDASISGEGPAMTAKLDVARAK